jgi:hypothetical protein
MYHNIDGPTFALQLALYSSLFYLEGAATAATVLRTLWWRKKVFQLAMEQLQCSQGPWV